IGIAFLLHIYSTGRRNAFGPSEAQRPACCIQHVYAHIAYDAVAILHKLAPSSVRKAGKRTHRRGACPVFVVEEIRYRLLREFAVATHGKVAAEFDVRDLAEESGFHNIFLGVNQVGGAAALCADLDYT